MGAVDGSMKRAAYVLNPPPSPVPNRLKVVSVGGNRKNMYLFTVVPLSVLVPFSVILDRKNMYLFTVVPLSVLVPLSVQINKTSFQYLLHPHAASHQSKHGALHPQKP